MKKSKIYEPDFRIIELPGERMEVELRCDPSFFGVFEEGYEVEWYFYDYPERRLTEVVLTRCVGKVIINGEECFEFHSFDGERNFELSRQSYYTFRDDGIYCITREKDKPAVEEQKDYVLPLKLYPGFERRAESEGEVLLERVTDVVLLDFGPKRFKCLRYLWVSEPESTERMVAVETFIDDKGWNILFRRYNGRGWKNIERLKECPKMEIEGETFYLWYDCVPDFVFP